MCKVVIIFGTRPEIIKFYPIINCLNETKIKTSSIFTGQHTDLAVSLLKVLNIKPDVILPAIPKDRSLNRLISHIILQVDNVLSELSPDFVMVQGDTTTALAASIACFHRRIKIIHVEAGLRTNDLYAPYPEEMNRRYISIVSAVHFAPTESNRRTLINEGISPSVIHVVGNTAIDALRLISNKNVNINLPINQYNRLILITCHRRENAGSGIRDVYNAIKKLSGDHLDTLFVFPAHPNNIVHENIDIISNIENVRIIKPLEYDQFVALMKQCYLIITDSGGLQEEAAFLGKPVVVLRESTERQDGVDSGIAQLVGHDINKICSSVDQFINNIELYNKIAVSRDIYGDGYAANKIVDILCESYAKRMV